MDLYFCFIGGILVAEEPLPYGTFERVRSADTDGMIDLSHVMRLEFFEEWLESSLGLRDQDDTRSIPIDAVHEGWLPSQGIIFPSEVILHLFDERAFCSFMVTRMYSEPRGLIDRDDIIIFVEYLEMGSRFFFFESGDRLGLEIGIQKKSNLIPQFESVIGLLFFSIDLDFPSTQEFIDGGKREVWEVFFEKFIEALPSIIREFYDDSLHGDIIAGWQNRGPCSW